MIPLTVFEKELLDILQNCFPIVSNPYEVIAAHLKVSQDIVLNTIDKLKIEKIIREIIPIYSAEKLGFRSSLIAFNVPENDIDNVGNNIYNHPGISHCYKRDNNFNLWFTLAIPIRFNYNHSVTKIIEENRISNYLILDSRKMFKRKVIFNFTDNYKIIKPCPVSNQINISYILKNTKMLSDILKDLQCDLSTNTKPFLKIAERNNISEEDLLDLIRQLIIDRYILRYTAIVKNYSIGMSSNFMVVWNINDVIADDFGTKASSYNNISHCYLRDAYPEWRYNLYTMIHGSNDKDCLDVISKLATEFKLSDYKLLKSIKEYKKQKVNYFSNEYEKWCAY